MLFPIGVGRLWGGLHVGGSVHNRGAEDEATTGKAVRTAFGVGSAEVVKASGRDKEACESERGRLWDIQLSDRRATRRLYMAPYVWHNDDVRCSE